MPIVNVDRRDRGRRSLMVDACRRPSPPVPCRRRPPRPGADRDRDGPGHDRFAAARRGARGDARQLVDRRADPVPSDEPERARLGRRPRTAGRGGRRHRREHLPPQHGRHRRAVPDARRAFTTRARSCRRGAICSGRRCTPRTRAGCAWSGASI